MSKNLPKPSARAPASANNLVAKIMDRYGAMEFDVERWREVRGIPDAPRLPPEYVRELPAHREARLAQFRHSVTRYAEEFEQRFGTVQELEEQRSEIASALRHRSDERLVRAIVSTMLEGLPAAGGQISATYIDAQVDCILFEDPAPSAHVLARAVRLIWLTERFAPGHGDVIAAIIAARDDYARALANVTRLLADRETAEAGCVGVAVEKSRVAVLGESQALARINRKPPSEPLYDSTL